MNTQANAINESPREAQAVSPARRFYWSVRREFWENRSIYLAPLAVAVLILVASLIGGALDFSFYVRTTSQGPSLDPMQQEMIEHTFAALLLMFVTLVVAVFYSIDALQNERRDRSILFWKSLPVSDLTTVLAKASFPLVIIPLLTFAVTVVTQFGMLLIGSARLLVAGQSVGMLWTHLSFFSMSMMLLYHLVVIHGLWWAPFYGWFLLVSAWARRAAFLWAILPPLAIGLLEMIAFNTTHFARMLGNRFDSGPSSAPKGHEMTMSSLTPSSPLHFLFSPGMLIGLAIFAACLLLAARLRRNRGPI